MRHLSALAKACLAAGLIIVWSCSSPFKSDSGGGNNSSAQWTCNYADATSGSHCGCTIGSAVDFAADQSVLELCPFGVHGTYGHIEGHRGIDYISNVRTTAVLSPVDGVVQAFSNSDDASTTNEFKPGGTLHFTTIIANCGIRVLLVPVLLDAGIGAGTKVTRGQRIGVMPEVTQGHRWVTHFELDARVGTDPAQSAVCPADLVLAGDRASFQSVLNVSGYVEQAARTTAVTCDNGTTLNIALPAEGQLCNPRLDSQARAQLASCKASLASQIGIW